MKKPDIILHELNDITYELFRLYSVGMYNDATSKATYVLRTAKEKLGRWHPFIYHYYENLEFVKNYKNGDRNKQQVIGGRSSYYKEENYNELRELNDNIIEYLQMKRYSDANKTLKKALSLAIRTFGNNHPYVKVLRQNIFTLESKNPDAILPKSIQNERKKKKRVINYGRLLAFGTIFMLLSILFLFLIGLTFLKYSIPTMEIPKIDNDFVNRISAISSHSYELKDKNFIDAPLILQNPELPKGCEVTSLTMLLQYSGIPIDKLTLAKEVKKDTTPYRVIDGRVHFGNPEYGFVGDMYHLTTPGLGVYHGPIKELAEEYLPNQVIDLTGRPFDDIFYFLSNDIPVWVITTTDFNELSPKDFRVWYTSYGPIEVSYKQHSVLVTGYDDKYVYFNNPLSPNGKKNQRVPIEQFKESWIQMGRQAISYVPNDKKLIDILPLSD